MLKGIFSETIYVYTYVLNIFRGKVILPRPRPAPPPPQRQNEPLKGPSRLG